MISTSITRGLHAEHGVAMPIALAVLLIVTLLGGAATVAAVDTSGLSNRDANTKLALAAADAGLQAATYRLSVTQPDATVVPPAVATHCVTNAGAITPNYPSASPTVCYDGPQAYGAQSPDPSAILGNGNSFEYWMTLPLAAGQACAGLAVVNQVGITQRCVTAIGTANGIAARVEARVAALAAKPLFPIPGMIGLKEVSMFNNAMIAGRAATNGTLSINQSTLGEAVLGPSAVATKDGVVLPDGGSAPVVTRRSPGEGPIVLSPVDPGTSATSSDGNDRIKNAWRSPQVVPFDAASSTTRIIWDPVKRDLTIPAGESLTLGGGDYNFCSLTISGGTLAVANGPAKARIFIDSPERTGSGCDPNAANAGVLAVTNNGKLTNPGGDPTALQLYVYGRAADGANTVTFDSYTPTFAVLYAPQSTINMFNNAGINGDIAAQRIVSLGVQGQYEGTNVDTYDPRVNDLRARSTGLYYRTAWEQCPSQPTTVGVPRSGC